MIPCHSDNVSRTFDRLQDFGECLCGLKGAYQTVCSRAVAGWMSQERMKRMSHLGCMRKCLT